MSNQRWLEFVERFSAAYTHGEQIPLADQSAAPDPALPMGADRHEVIICSPHPDDECIAGALALRLKAAEASVLNLAFTLGSDPARQEARRAELAAACRALGFDCRLAADPLGFSDLGPKMAAGQEQEMLAAVLDLFNRESPALVIMPHAEDGHPTHIATHRLAMAALIRHSLAQDREILVAESEFWQPQARPNLLLGLSEQTVAAMIAALTCHRGEMARNPYHLRLPARLLDNVRRGGEAAGFGRQAPDIRYAELYSLSKIECGNKTEITGEMLTMAPDMDLSLSRLLTLCNQAQIQWLSQELEIEELK